MKLRKRNAFTLIELIATLVIMAIIALIVTPLVMSIIRKAKISADKRSIDAYGRSIELAIASYLLDTGKFATSIDELTIEYSGNEVVCTTTQINPDSSVYLSNCKVNNRNVTNYTYGSDKSPSYEAYSIGDEVTYNGVDYYVIKDSGAKDNVVTLLKATPLTTEEVNRYGGVGTENNHVNRYTYTSQGTALDYNGYGGLLYYSSATCDTKNGFDGIYSGCKNDYASSDIKYVIDAWTRVKVQEKAKQTRLITKDEYEALSTVETYETPTQPGSRYVPKYDFLKNNKSNYYWTMSPRDDSTESIFMISSEGQLTNSAGSVCNIPYTVRPVVELYKNDGITRKNSSNN